MRSFYLALLLFIVSFLLYSSMISKGPVTVDCLSLVLQVEKIFATHQFTYLYGSGYPAMVVLGFIFTAIGRAVGFNDSVVVLNLIGVLSGALSITIFFLLMRRLCDRITAILAALLLTLNPIFIDISTYGISHGPCVCFMLLGFFFLAVFFKEGGSFRFFISGIFFGLMGATRVQDLVLMLPFIAMMTFLALNRIPLRKRVKTAFLFFGLIGIIVLLFHAIYFMGQNGYDVQLKVFLHTGLIENFKGFLLASVKRSYLYITQDFSYTGTACYLAGILYLIGSDKKILLFSVLWWLIPLGFYGNLLMMCPRYYAFLLPAFIIPIAVLLGALVKHKSLMLRIGAYISIVMIILGPLSDTLGTFMRRHEHALLPEYYEWIGNIVEPNAGIIGCDDGLFIQRYTKREFLEKPASFGHINRESLTVFKKNVDAYLDNGRPVYITDMLGLFPYDKYGEFRQFMLSNYQLTTVARGDLEDWFSTPFWIEVYESSIIKVEKMVR